MTEGKDEGFPQAPSIPFHYENRSHKADIGKELSTGDPYDPHALAGAMDRLPGLFAFYANVLRDAKIQLGGIREAKIGVAAKLKRMISENIQAARPEGSKKPVAAAEVDREFDRAVHEHQDPTIQNSYPELLEEYIKQRDEEQSWIENIESLSVIVDTVRLRCTLIRSQGDLVQAMLQQNLITPRRAQPPRIGSSEDDGGM